MGRSCTGAKRGSTRRSAGAHSGAVAFRCACHIAYAHSGTVAFRCASYVAYADSGTVAFRCAGHSACAYSSTVVAVASGPTIYSARSNTTTQAPLGAPLVLAQ